jgi:hypothetical protein
MKLFDQAQVLALEGDDRAAVRLIKRALGYNPQKREGFLFELALCYKRLGQPEYACEVLEGLIDESDDDFWEDTARQELLRMRRRARGQR